MTQRGRVDRTALFVVGLGHTGTTILDMAIGTHPDACSLGEVKKLRKAVEADKVCTCGQPLSQCSFWSEVASRVRARTGKTLGDLDVNSGSGDNVTLFDAIFRVSGSLVAVDSSMNLFRAQRVRDELRGRYRVLILHVVRDIRSWSLSREQANERNIHSRGRREAGPKELGYKWTSAFLRTRKAGSHRGWRYLRVRHEDLCSDPETVVAKVCSWAGMSPHPFTGNLDAEYHLFAGNRARNTATRVEPARESWRSDAFFARLTAYGYPAAVTARFLGYSTPTRRPDDSMWLRKGPPPAVDVNSPEINRSGVDGADTAAVGNRGVGVSR